MFIFLGEFNTFEDLANVVGIPQATKAWGGKISYFVNTSTGEVFGADAAQADAIFHRMQKMFIEEDNK